MLGILMKNSQQETSISKSLMKNSSPAVTVGAPQGHALVAMAILSASTNASPLCSLCSDTVRRRAAATWLLEAGTTFLQDALRRPTSPMASTETTQPITTVTHVAAMMEGTRQLVQLMPLVGMLLSLVSTVAACTTTNNNNNRLEVSW